jgi:cytochrome c-type biogenesis protein CcmH
MAHHTRVRWRAVRVTLASLLLAAIMASAAHAVEPGERLADPNQEIRARALSTEFRCLVCQNQSIDDSNAPLARDLRVLVREQISAGKSDADIIAYVVSRYGEFVLLRPRLTAQTALLWLTPLLLLAAAAAFLWHRRTLATVEPGPLSSDETKRLEALLQQPSATTDSSKPNLKPKSQT